VGTVYTLSSTGSENVIYNFAGAPDGANPAGPLALYGGAFYGTTANGGQNGTGTIFSITSSGAETVLHSFGNGPSDGQFPHAGLVLLNGAFFGTTVSTGPNYQGGTVFRSTTSGSVRQIYAFTGAPDGEAPLGNMTALNGTLYGTTGEGGPTASGRYSA
jgi:uncharacterized repeat protein (TIGR03803 family)